MPTKSGTGAEKVAEESFQLDTSPSHEQSDTQL